MREIRRKVAEGEAASLYKGKNITFRLFIGTIRKSRESRFNDLQ